MERNQLIAIISWTGENFGCSWSDPEAGSVVVTGKTIEEVKEKFEESLKWHIEGCVEDGDLLPSYLVHNEYSIHYELETAAMLQDAERYTSLEAISKVSGINAKQLSHYANGLKQPRKPQRDRIIQGLHEIGRRFLAMY